MRRILFLWIAGLILASPAEAGIIWGPYVGSIGGTVYGEGVYVGNPTSGGHDNAPCTDTMHHIYTSPSTFTFPIPAGCQLMFFNIVGGGGGGVSGLPGVSGGTGGAVSNFAHLGRQYQAGDNMTITVGAGGASFTDHGDGGGYSALYKNRIGDDGVDPLVIEGGGGGAGGGPTGANGGNGGYNINAGGAPPGGGAGDASGCSGGSGGGYPGGDLVSCGSGAQGGSGTAGGTSGVIGVDWTSDPSSGGGGAGGTTTGANGGGGGGGYGGGGGGGCNDTDCGGGGGGGTRSLAEDDIPQECIDAGGSGAGGNSSDGQSGCVEIWFQ